MIFFFFFLLIKLDQQGYISMRREAMKKQTVMIILADQDILYVTL